jgi:type I restriction enzyme S subunit
MKDSGIEWIEEIPENWDIVKLKYYSYMKGRIGWQGLGSSDFIDEGPYCVTGTDFINGKVNWETCYHVSEERYEMDKFIQIQVGDLLITKDGTIGKLAKITELPDKACLNSHLLIIRPLHNRFSNEYLYYVLSSYVFWKYYTIHSSGSIMASLSQEKLKDFSFPVPSLKEQQLLVSYLDRQCALIDSVIEKTKASIEEYKKLRQAVITQAVTKGVRGDRAMKDSGIKWIGEIPQEWDIVKLKRVSVKIGDGLHSTPEYDENGDYYFLNGNNIGSENLVFKDNTDRLNEEEYKKYKPSILSDNTILITLNGATYGKTSFYNGEKVLLGKSAGYITLISDTSKKYVRYYLASNISKILMDLSLNGTTIANLSLTTLNNFPLPLPKKCEQQEIAEYLDKKCTEIDSLITKKEQFLTELDSYKKSLIYEYVTGKKEVPQA